MKENKGNKKRKLVSLSLKASLYKTLHKTIESLVDECRLEFNKSGLSISIVDPANVAMYSTTLSKDVFEDYNLVKPFEVGYELIVVEHIGLMEAYNMGTVQLDIFEVEGITDEPAYVCDVKHDIFKDSIKLPSSSYIRSKLPSSSYIRSKPKIPELKSECVFDVTTKTMMKIAGHSDEHIGVIFENGKVVFSSDKSDPTWTTEGITVKSKKYGKALYSTVYMVDIFKALPKKSDIHFKFSDDYPCELSCEIVKGFTVNWLIAPRIESD